MKVHRKLLILYNNGSVAMIKEKKYKYDKNQVSVLVPVLGIKESVYIPIRPTKLLNFTNVKFKIRLQYRNFDLDTGNVDTVDFKEMDISSNSIIEVINYIHSLEITDYCSAMMQRAMTETCMLNFLDVEYFQIQVFNNKETVYMKEYMIECGEGFDDNSNIGALIHSIKKFYKINVDDFYFIDSANINNLLFIDGNGRWDCRKKRFGNGACGVYLQQSTSIAFISFDNYKLLDDGSPCYTCMSVYNKRDKARQLPNKDITQQDIETCELDVYFTFYTSFDLPHEIIEFLIYIACIYNNTMLMYNYCIFEVDDDDPGFDIFTDMEFHMTDKKEVDHIVFDGNHIPSFYDTLNKLKRMNS